MGATSFLTRELVLLFAKQLVRQMHGLYLIKLSFYVVLFVSMVFFYCTCLTGHTCLGLRSKLQIIRYEKNASRYCLHMQAGCHLWFMHEDWSHPYFAWKGNLVDFFCWFWTQLKAVSEYLNYLSFEEFLESKLSRIELSYI